MELIEILSLVAGLMTMAAPMAQALKTIHTRNVQGLSAASYLLLLCLGVFAVLIGVQYGIFFMTLLNALGMAANVAIMYLISRKLLAVFVLALAALVGLAALAAPAFLEALVTTRWAEQVAFIYGLVAAATFLPQVLLTRRTRSVSALSLPNLVLFTAGLSLWILVSVMLDNYSLIFWNGLLLLMIAELLRLKLTIERGGAPTKENLVTPAPII